MSSAKAYELPQGITGRLILPASEYGKDRRRWHEARKYGIGASNISAILGQNKFKSPLQVWEEKTSDEIPDDNAIAEAAFWGLKNEHNVASVFTTRNPKLGKLSPSPGILAHPENDILRATLDRVLVKRRSKPAVAVAGIECKTVGDFAYKNYWADGLPPVHIQLQTQYQMGVSGLDRIYVPALVGGNWMPEAYVADRDDALIEKLFDFADRWWNDHIVAGIRPDTTWQDADRMSEIWPARVPAPRVQATAKLADLIGRHLDAKRRETEAKADKELLAYQIQDIMRDAEEVVDALGNVICTWKRPKPSYQVDGARLKAEKPDIYEEYLKEKKSSRTFVTKEIDQ